MKLRDQGKILLFFCFDVIRTILSSLGFCNCPIEKGNARIQGCQNGGGHPTHPY